MYLPALLTIGIAATTASACTFAMDATNYANTGDGSGGGGCNIFIYEKDVSKDDIGTGDAKSDFSGDGTCDKGCNTVEYKGKKWEFCHSILSPFKADVTDSTYVSVREVDNNGDTLSVYPDGDFKSFSSYSPFNSYLSNMFFRSGISC
ncbi:hypothetical protein PENSTE_c034G03729 [Penicillium steckii]|uniref:Uncharacterized protein n=1 Tax=Penicillium steckii TaxID=303698 RepID=A0A1V6SM32_9EURO|nr:hypothetical protein PENSTE_c034G03729 [Penicillium steckii]